MVRTVVGPRRPAPGARPAATGEGARGGIPAIPVIPVRQAVPGRYHCR
ncbi:hypothetical protein SNOUR_26540 [Streptomyces noursei ATCC 11455]|nr:hypothetical protein SNOUR_26540 [Streptomyces noursei ATCC 11455]